MRTIAATCLDEGYKSNQAILEAAAKRIERAVTLLTAEIVALVIALIVILVS